jgi:hypothetical protein
MSQAVPRQTSPLVSVVVPFRDPGTGMLLQQACRSIEAQRETRWEALLVNDDSSRAARAAAERICERDSRFRLLDVPRESLPHSPGPWLARNLGIAAARAEWIAFLDGDDLWHPAKLRHQLPLHLERGINLSVTGYHRFRGRDLQVVETRRPPAGLTFRRLLHGNVIPLSSVVVARQLLGSGFRAERHEDYGLWLRLFASDPPPRYGALREPLMAYRLHSGSLSSGRALSLLAVERLFRQHLGSRRQRFAALGLWALRRGADLAQRGLLPTARDPDLPSDRRLPSPYRDWLREEV